MKRFSAALLALALLLSAVALAFEGQGYPSWDGLSAPEDSIYGSFDGEKLQLEFDTAPDYSNVAEGLIQACFFAYDAAEEHYLELYLFFPDTAAPGDTFSATDGSGASVLLYETAVGDEDFYCSDEQGSAESSFELHIDSAETGAPGLTISGSLNASLRQYDLDDRPMRDSVAIEDARFNFTLPLSGDGLSPAPTPEPDEAFPEVTFPALPDEDDDSRFAFPDLPDAGDEPRATFPALPEQPEQPRRGDRPAFTLPPDYAEI